MEDKSVESVYYCMNDHSMAFINQTAESLGNISSAANDPSAAIGFHNHGEGHH